MNTKQRLNKITGFFIVLLISIVPLLLLEVRARMLGRPELILIPSNDFSLIYELNPSYPGINSWGMRNDEVDLSTLHDYYFVAVIGDSHAYSTGSERREDSFPARLESHLTALTGKRIKVLNFGVPGYNMHQELELLKAKVLRLKPDLIVLQYCINDTHISNLIQPKYKWLNSAISKSTFLTDLWKTFLYSGFGQKHILYYIENYFPDLLLYRPGLVGTPRPLGEKDPAHAAPHPPRNRDQVPVKYWDFIGQENFERDVKIFGELSKKANIPALATGFIEEQDRNLYERAGFKVYSFFQIFQGIDMQSYGYNPAKTNDHFSDLGSDFIGNALADFIRGEFNLSRGEGHVAAELQKGR